MSQKNLLITIHHAPHASVFVAEGLRAAMGATSSVDEHNVTVLFLGDGAWAALAGVDRSEVVRSVDTLIDLGYELKLDGESLAERGIRAEEVAHDIGIVSRPQLLALVEAADFTIDF